MMVMLMVVMVVSLSMFNLSFSWCEANIIKNSLVPIWPAAQFLFVITSLHTAIAPPKVVELIRMANAIFGIVTSDGLGIAVGALFTYILVSFERYC